MFSFNASRRPLPRPFLVGKACVAIAALTGIHLFPLTKAVLAQAVIPGIVIENQATGSYVDPVDSTTYTLESNIVQVTVAEVAGITLIPAGIQEAPAEPGSPITQDDGDFDPDDTVYFLFEATNVGNDPTQFFIPGTPSTLTNGTQAGPVEIISIDPDGSSGPISPTDFSALPITIRPEGNNTGDATALGMPVGAIPADGTVTIRVPFKIDSGVSLTDTIGLTLGNTGPNDNTAATQNQDYIDDGNFQDFYTQDNQDSDGILNEGAGLPANGDATNHRKEASARSTLTLSDTPSNLYVLSGFLFEDLDLSDSKSGSEPGLADIPVRLYLDLNDDGQLTVADDSDNDGDIDADDAVSTTNTDSSGFYQFERGNGNYLLDFDATDQNLITLSYGGLTGLPNDVLNLPRNVDINGADVTTGLDFPFDAVVNGTDYGDAPDSYDTNAPTGAVHSIVSDIYLGNIPPDSETDAVAPLDATGDGDEDDGVILIPIEQNTTTYRTITVTGEGALNAWIDWNGNLTFDPDEQIATDVVDGGGDDQDNSSGTITLQINAPASAVVGTTYARFRYSSQTGLGPAGSARNGEVEDYAVEIRAENPNQTIVEEPSDTSCLAQGGRLIGANLFTDLDNGTMGFENGDPNQSPATNPYTNPDGSSIVMGGDFTQYEFGATDGQFFNPTYGDYAYVANLQNPRNVFQHEGITDPVYGPTGRFFVSDPDGDTPSMSVTISGLTPNTFYEYSFWAANAEPDTNGQNNNIDILIGLGGEPLVTKYSTGALPELPVLEWKKHTFTFTNGPNTSVDIQLKSTETGQGGNDFNLDNIELRECDFDIDFGDAPASYGEAAHTTLTTNPTVYLGVIPADGEVVSQTSAAADGDDLQGDDEDAFVTLPSASLSGSYSLTVPVNNSSGNEVTLHGWVDFDKNGVFGPDEYISTTVADSVTSVPLTWIIPSGVTAGPTFARFRISPNELPPDVIEPTGLQVDDRSINAVIQGEVEDYLVSLGAPPEVLLVKRITAINDQPVNPLDGTNLSLYVDGTGDTDNHPYWPEGPDSGSEPDLYGAISAGTVEPGDVVEYTIYFLSSGNRPANNVVFCDRLPDGQTFVPNPSFAGVSPTPTQSVTGVSGEEQGILVSYNGSNTTYTNIGGDDNARFYSPGSGLPAACNLLNNQSEHNGAIVVDLGDLPSATSPGTPANSYGFVRFRATVD